MPYKVSPRPSQLLAKEYGAELFGEEREFASLDRAMSYAKGIAHKIAEKLPGTGGQFFPLVSEELDGGEHVLHYTILAY